MSVVAMAASQAFAAVGQYRTARDNERSALAAQEDANAGLLERQHQFDQHATDQMVERSRQAVRDLGHVRAIFADSGLDGNSQDRIEAITEGEAQRDLTTLERNRQARATQTQAEASEIVARTQSRINERPRPSVLGSGLQIAATAFDAYDKRQRGK
jgi:hypothetical protein